METHYKSELRKIADRLALGEYPEALEAIYEAQKDSIEPACDLCTIDRLQKEYDIFGEFYDLVRQTAERINADSDRSAWIRTAAAYFRANNREQARKLPIPKFDGTPEMDLLMLYIVLPQILSGIETAKKRGLGEESVKEACNVYKSSLRTVRRQIGRPAINRAYYLWLILYAKALIFRTGGLQFAMDKLPTTALWLQNTQSQQIVPLILTGTYHRTGKMPLGAKNYEDAEGSFSPSFSEDEVNYYGHGCIDHVLSRELQTYPKAIWTCIGKPGDACLKMHIPKNADVSRSATMAACQNAVRLCREYFPEHGPVGSVYCSSWLLNPRFKEIQGEGSRITQFEECFVKYPDRDPDGHAVFNFVFVRKPEKLEDLQEDTSLQRKLKKIYLEGDCIHTYSGVIFIKA